MLSLDVAMDDVYSVRRNQRRSHLDGNLKRVFNV
jgi:hypothetical protein